MLLQHCQTKVHTTSAFMTQYLALILDGAIIYISSLTCLDSCEKSQHGSFIQCPLCRQSTTLGMKGIEGLKNNFVISNMISMMEEWSKVHTR